MQLQLPQPAWRLVGKVDCKSTSLLYGVYLPAGLRFTVAGARPNNCSLHQCSSPTVMAADCPSPVLYSAPDDCHCPHWYCDQLSATGQCLSVLVTNNATFSPDSICLCCRRTIGVPKRMGPLRQRVSWWSRRLSLKPLQALLWSACETIPD